MKTVGIKLADGSFYPVMEEGSAQAKKLDLTTAHKNQTCVMVDMYRSKTCSMDDAEYIDTLKIDNLNAHANGEPDISFDVALDENGKLSASISDPETGATSNSNITLVSRTLEERLQADDYTISHASLSDQTVVSEEELADEEPVVEDSAEETESEDSNAGVVVAGAAAAVAGGGLLARAAAMKKEDEEKNMTEKTDSFDENDFNLGDPSFNESTEETIADETLSEDTLPDFDDDFATSTEPETSDTLSDETFTTEEPFSFEESEAPVTEETDDIFTLDESPAVDETIAADDDIFAMDDTPATDETITADDDIFAMDDTPATDETIAADDPFSFDDTPTEETAAPEDPFADDFNIDETIAATESDSLEEDVFGESSTDNIDDSSAAMAGAGGISFTGLYDKETAMGDSANHDEEKASKNTKIPVIICIICAIICLLATALILFIIPSRANLISKKPAKANKENTVAIEKPAETPAPAVEEKKPAPKAEPVPAAKEDEVVVIEKAEEVIPVPPPAVEQKPAEVTYKIKWGDTLWDIADTYYKNPWKYKKIASYNGIKNPDHIISGTIITIPSN